MRSQSGTSVVSGLPEDFYERVKEDLWERIAGEFRFDAQVVDLGCGACELARFLARRNRQHVIGVDISDSGFPASQAVNSRLECRKADVRRLDFMEDHSVDAVVSVYALHEMAEPLDVMKEANRVMRRGGDILIVDFPRGSLAQRLWNENYYVPTEVVGMLRRAGFANVKSRRIARRQIIWAEGRKPPARKAIR